MMCLITGGHEPQQSGQNPATQATCTEAEALEVLCPSVSERASQRRGYSRRRMQSDRADNFARGSGLYTMIRHAIHRRTTHGSKSYLRRHAASAGRKSGTKQARA